MIAGPPPSVIDVFIDKEAASGSMRAFLRQNGVMTDLNTLIPANSPLYLLLAHGINSRGEIVGFGVNSASEFHAFLATPCDRSNADSEGCNDDGEAAAAEGDQINERPKPVLPENVRKLFQQGLGFGRFGFLPTAPR